MRSSAAINQQLAAQALRDYRQPGNNKQILSGHSSFIVALNEVTSPASVTANSDYRGNVASSAHSGVAASSGAGNSYRPNTFSK